MNYYAKGGQAHGLKALAQELPKYGRYGDNMVAHISSDEARMLKAMGGSGTINPDTGLPEFFFKGGGNPFKAVTQVFKPVQQAVAAINPFNPGSALSQGINQIPVIGGVNRALNDIGTQVFQPLEKAIVQPASRGLAQFDKAVGNTIPGGWGTVASVAGSAMGLPTPFLVGLGALNGSGVTRKGGSFNLQGAMMGGAMAYGAAELGEYMRGAVPPTGAESSFNALPASAEAATDGISSLYNATSGFAEPVTSSIPQGAINAANAASGAAQTINPATGLQYGSVLGDSIVGNAPVTPSIGSQIMSGNFGDALSQVGTNISEGIGNLGTKAVNAYDTVVDPQTYSDLGTKASTYADARLADASKTSQGAMNLLGIGEGTSKEAAALAAKTGVKPLMAAGAVAYGGMGLMALEEQRKYLEEAKAAQTITDTEYNNAMAEVNRSTEDARRAVRESPFSTTPNRDVSIGDTYYGRTGADENLYSRLTGESKLYAMGGSVDDEYGMDEARGLNQGNLQNGLFARSMPSYAAGGMPPRFLSGGGDGMSDDIKATINGNQEARLADGEFVVPADVVSHLGNGSSKAGAKQLYSMMDKVRTARTGRKSQGKQINPRKYLTA
jgi:hypothetical protein